MCNNTQKKKAAGAGKDFTLFFGVMLHFNFKCALKARQLKAQPLKAGQLKAQPLKAQPSKAKPLKVAWNKFSHLLL